MNNVAMSIHCMPFGHVYMESRNLTSWICLAFVDTAR